AAVHASNWVVAVELDLRFHSQLIRFHRSKRLESFYQKLIGELRMGMVMVDRVHDDPSALIPLHRDILTLLASGQAEQSDVLLAKDLEDSECRLRDIVGSYAKARRVRTGT